MISLVSQKVIYTTPLCFASPSTLQEKVEHESFLCAEHEPTKEYSMKAKDLDKIFDDGEVDINDYLDLSKAFRPGQEQKRVNVDFPIWMIDRLDREANRLGVPRQSLIKVWIGEHLEMAKSKRLKKADKVG